MVRDAEHRRRREAQLSGRSFMERPLGTQNGQEVLGDRRQRARIPDRRKTSLNHRRQRNRDHARKPQAANNVGCTGNAEPGSHHGQHLHVNCGVRPQSRCEGDAAYSTAARKRPARQRTGHSCRQDGAQQIPWIGGLSVQLRARRLLLRYSSRRRRRSLMVRRMTALAAPLRMPRLGSDRVDDEGVRAVSVWIEAMTPARGYVDAAP